MLQKFGAPAEKLTVKITYHFRRATSWLVLASWLSGIHPALAVDLLDTAENIFYRPGDQTRMGLEVELKGLKPREVATEVQAALGGKIEIATEETKTRIIGHQLDGRMPIYDTVNTEYYILKGSSIGDVILKPDYNQVTDEFRADQADNVVTEIVTPPIRMPEVEKLQGALARLKEKGAQGTYPNGGPKPGSGAKVEALPVSTQVNVEWMGGKRENMKPADLVNLLRSYVRPEHREQIDAHLKVPEIRKPYIGVFSDGFMKKLLDPNYNPDFRQLYDDYIYRQSLERLYTQENFDTPPTAEERKLIAKGKDAWTMPIEEAKKTLIGLGDLAVVPKVVKQNPLRISSLLMFLYPEDHMSKLYDASGWAKGRPLVEFREWNNKFSVTSEAKQALGLVEGAKKYGYYDHDKLLASISTMDERAIKALRKDVNMKGREGRTVFRYYLGDAKSIERSDYAEQSNFYRVGKVGFLPYGEYGQAPLRIPGESVVMHRRPQHRNSVLGKYNPGLINHNVAQAMENKLVEAKVWEKFAPGTMPETKSLVEVKEFADPAKMVAKLNQQFPKGWVMKGVWDLGSEKDIITDKTDVVDALKRYNPAEFEKRKQALEDDFKKLKDAAPEYLQTELKKDPGYKGWRISQMLSKPDLVIVQNKVDIDREFRVEVVAGKVLGKGTTIDRFKYMYEVGVDGLSMKDYRAPPAGSAEKVEKFAQEAVNKLPAELRGMPFGMDIALLKDGRLAMIESNPGGNSNFLYEEHKESVIELGEFLRRYPEAVKSGQISEKVAQGMSPERQMQFLDQLFRENKIDPKKQYPGIEFKADRLDDAEFKVAQAKPEDFAVVAKASRSAPAEASRSAPAEASRSAPAEASRSAPAESVVATQKAPVDGGATALSAAGAPEPKPAKIPDAPAPRIDAPASSSKVVALEAPRVSTAGRASVQTGLAQSLMSVIMDKDLKRRGLESEAGYHFIQGIGDADSVMDLAIKKPIQSHGLQLARSGLGLAAKGIGIYGAGMSVMQLRQAITDGDGAATASAATKTTVLGGSVVRQFATPVTERLIASGGEALVRRAGTSGAAKVLGTVTGPVGLTVLAVGDVGAMAVEWRANAYYGSIGKIYGSPQFEALNFGPGFYKSLLTNAGIRGSLKALETNVDPEMRETRFKSESQALVEGLAMREVLGLSTEPVAGDDLYALAKHLQANGAFNPLASNVPKIIRDLCKKGELKCTRTERRYNVGMGGRGGVGGSNSFYEAPVQDYSVAMADYLLKEKSKFKARFEKEWKEALASGKADTDWLAFIQEKEKLEREYTPRLQKEADELAKKKDAKPDDQTPLQKEYAAKIYEAYGRTMRPAQVTDSMLEHAGLVRHVMAEEKKQLRDSVRKATTGGKTGPQAAKTLQSELVALESQVLSRKTGIPAEQIRSNPVEARLAVRKEAFREGMKIEGIEVEKLPAGVREAIDDVLKRKLELEAGTRPLEERPAEAEKSIYQADLQLEALLYGIQMGQREPRMTEARVREHALRFLEARSGERKAANMASEAVEQLESKLAPEEQEGRGDRREFEQRSRSRGAPQVASPRNRPAAPGSVSTAR